MKQRTKFISAALGSLSILLCVFALFRILYLYDNKYTAGPPHGENGIFSFTPADLDRPLFLVDGWLLSVNNQREQETFIGQYSNFSYVSGGSPFGTATYRLILQCPGVHTLMLEIPEIFTDYILYLNGSPIAMRGSGTSVGFTLEESAELRLEVSNRTHYYSGLYYPPALGSPQEISTLLSTRLALYTALAVCALTLAVFSAVFWLSRTRNRLFFHFGLLSLSFFLTVLHPILWHLGWSGTFGYALEDAGRLFMLFQTVEIAALLAGWAEKQSYRRMVRPIGIGICALCVCSVCFIIPALGETINLYGYFVDGITLLGWLFFSLCTAACLRQDAVGSTFLAAGCCAYGGGLLVNLLNNNRFEPIYTFWQGEWAGFLLVLFFAGLMIRYNRDVLLKNRQLVTHMEELVQERTRELNTLLEERKRFFDHMAHNLKAPITAVHGFISLIRESNLYLDDELREYIRLIEEENEEISRRVQSLSALHIFDTVTAPKVPIHVDDLLAEVGRQNMPEAGAAGVHLVITLLERPVKVLGQWEKLLTAFENLIYNSLAFTPPNGSITITPQQMGHTVVIKVADSGAGIAPEHLPHIFEQFYSVRAGKNEGSGLGLYIVKLTMEELGGTVTAQSLPGKGTQFYLTLPLCP